MEGQLIASFLAGASNGVLRSGAITTNARVSMSYFLHAQTAPMMNVPALPGVGDPDLDTGLRRVFGRAMECLGTKTNTGTFVGLERSIHQAKTHVSAYSFAIPKPQTLTYLSLHR
jgi:hypothetical protein